MRFLSLEPWVGQDVLDGEALCGVLCEHARDQILGRLAKSSESGVGLEVERLVADALLAFSAVIIPEGKLSAGENVHESANAVDVTAKAVLLALEHLRCSVAWGANLEVGGGLGVLKLDSAAKITDLERGVVTVVGHQDVFDLDVSVNNVS